MTLTPKGSIEFSYICVNLSRRENIAMNIRIVRPVLFSLLVLFTTAGFSQLLDPVKWDIKAEPSGENGEYEIIFKAKVKDGWWIYSQFLEEDGPIPTTIYFDDESAFTKMGQASESGSKKVSEFDENFEMELIKFKKDMTLIQKIRLNDDISSATVSGYIEFMTCDKTRCLPPKGIDFSFDLTREASNGATEMKKENEAQQTEENESFTITLSDEDDSEAEAPAEQAPMILEDGFIAIPTIENFPGELAPVDWSYKIEQVEGENYSLTFQANVEEGWTIYSQTIDGDGPIPTSFNYEELNGAELVGDAKEIGEHKKEGPDPYFDGIFVTKYYDKVNFEQQLMIKDPDKEIKGYLEFMSCDDTQCLPPKALDFSIIPSGKALTADQPRMPVLQGAVLDQEVPTLKASYETPVGDCGKEDIAKNDSHAWTFILGFLGGLIALLTPCVFPMIPLTVSFFTKGSKDRKTGIRNGLLYGLSIIVIYVLIGLMITSFFGETALNELSTNWIANTLFFVIFIAFALSFFGYYEITLPSSWANKSDRMAERGGLIGIFFMAFTLALVSFSCTGPIIGSAIVQAATSKLGPFIVMLGFSTALALPFGLFAAFPAWLNSLPKSGSWMNSVKVVLGFLEVALAFKFLSVADMTMHWGILGYEIFMVIWIVVFAGLTLYLFGFIRFPHDSPLKKLSPTRWAFALGSLALTVYLATGFLYDEETKAYNALGLMSGLAPPATYNYLLPKPEIDQSIKQKYPSFTKCANNLPCFKDYYEGVSYAREVNKPILLDFTGYGCVNCRKTEEHIWVVDDVKSKLENDFILVSLYVDDRTPLDQIYISKTRQEKLRNIGNKWADFQIVNFEQNSQPLYVMVAPDEQVLSKPRGYKEGADDYAKFLECGLEVYEDYNEKLGKN